MDPNRRRYVRLDVTEETIAIDARGHQIGKVTQASGGGITVVAPNHEVADGLSIGERLQVTVMEPKSQTRNTIDVVLRRKSGQQLGFEFVTGGLIT
jgi:hypothetical protein